MVDKLMTIGEVAEQLRLSERTVRRYLIDRRLYGYKLPTECDERGEWRIPAKAVWYFLQGVPYQPESIQ